MKMLTASGSLLLHLRRALHIDVEDQVVAARERLAQKAARRAVIVAEDFGILQELVFADHPLKFLARDEEVLAARSARCPAAGAWCS